MKKTNFGIIACSNVAKNRFIPAILKSEYANLSFIASRKIDKAKIYAEKFGCNNYGNYEDALTNSKIDAVYISTPINFKKDLALDAAKNNKHVIMEKPAFLNQKDAQKVIKRFKLNNLHFLEGWMFKYHPQHKKFKALIKNNRFGKSRYFFSQFTYPTPSVGDIRLDPNLHGGVFYDSIGYPLAAALMVIDERPVSVSSMVTNNKIYGVDDFVIIQLEFENNIYADLIAGFGMQYKSVYSLLCESGIATVERAFAINENMSAKITIDTNDGKETITIKPENQFKLMIDNFCQDIFNQCIGYHEESIMLQQKIIDAALVSVKTKSNVKIRYS